MLIIKIWGIIMYSYLTTYLTNIAVLISLCLLFAVLVLFFMLHNYIHMNPCLGKVASIIKIFSFLDRFYYKQPSMQQYNGKWMYNSCYWVAYRTKTSIRCNYSLYGSCPLNSLFSQINKKRIKTLSNNKIIFFKK